MKTATITIALTAKSETNVAIRAESDVTSDHTDLQQAYAHGIMKLLADFFKEVGDMTEKLNMGHYGMVAGGKDTLPDAAESIVKFKQSLEKRGPSSLS